MSNVVILGAAHPHIFGLAKTAKGIEGLNIVGVYDADEATRNEAAEKIGVPAFANLNELLSCKPVLALVGAVPTYRAELCATACEAGASVLVDKPLALTHASLDNLKARVTKAGRPLSVYYPYRGYPMVLAAKAAVARGQIGQLVRVMSFGPHKINAPTRPAWHWTREGNGGALIDIGAHHFDLCHWLAGADPVYVSAMHANHSQPQHPEFQDIAQAQVRFANGVLGHVEVDWINPTAMKNFGDTRIWLAGTKGKIEIRLGDETSALLWNDQVAGQPVDQTEQTDENWLRKQMVDLAQGKQGDVPLRDVWTTSRLSLCAFDSAINNSAPVKVELK
jgi:predicted dehydrogenase